MNKFGHITITKNLSREMGLFARHRLFLTFGSILPDLLVHTLAGGHTRNATQEMVLEKMHQLQQTGQTDCLSFLRLGYILHYIEDYFTYPHNDWYSHGVKEHFVHEWALSRYAFSHRSQPLPPHPSLPVPALPHFLLRLHDRYETKTPGVVNDYRYIRLAIATVMESYIRHWQ